MTPTRCLRPPVLPRSDSPSTLATALGDHAPRRALPAPPPTASAGELLIAALGDALRELVFHDPRVREDLPDAVHRMRVAVTRIRAGLGTFPSLLSDEARSQLRPELAWLGRTLGSIRDHDVVNRRLTALLRAEPADLVLGPIAARMEHQFGLDFEQASAELRAALDSERYFRLLDTLEAVVSGQWLAPLANSRAKNTLSRLLNHRIAALRRAMRRADAAIDSPTHDLALHEVRKQAKRVRYAALVISPLRPKRATRLVTVATAMQDSLGDHQDSVIARQRLLRLSADAHAVGENTLSYGRLHAIEQSRGEHSEAEYEGLRRRARQALARD